MLLQSTANPVFEEALYAVDCSSDGKFVAVGGKHMGLTLRDATNHQIITALPSQENASHRPPSINSLRFSQDGKWLVCGLQNEMLILEVPSLKRIETFTGLSGPVSSVAFTPNGNTLVGVSERGMSQMVNLRIMRSVGNLVGSPGRLISAEFSPDGQTLAVSGLGTGVRILHSAL
jgi:WD40 repeat protein